MRRISYKGGLFTAPKRFRFASDVKAATYSDAPPGLARPRGRTVAQRRGLAFERRTLQLLADHFKDFKRGPWLQYQNSNGTWFCQPDGLVVLENSVIIFEVKYSHCMEAYWQLRHLYQPVVEALLPGFSTQVVEVPKSFDPHVEWPEDIELMTSVFDLKNLDGVFGVLWLR